jgi:hypothetical protein
MMILWDGREERKWFLCFTVLDLRDELDQINKIKMEIKIWHKVG